MEDTESLNNKRVEYKKILGIKKEIVDDEDLYNALARDIEIDF